MHSILIAAEIIISIILIIVVLVQPSKTDGFTGFITGNTDTFFAKNKSRTFESLMMKITIICAVIFAGVTLAINLLK